MSTQTSSTVTTRRMPRRDITAPPPPPRDLLMLALNAAGAMPCRLFADDFTFASVDDSIQARTGLDARRWCDDAFWDTHVHPEDRPLVAEAARGPAGRQVSLAFRIVSGDTTTSLRLLAQPRIDAALTRPVLDGYLFVTSVQDGSGADVATTSGILALQQTRRDLMRTAHLAMAGELVGAITHDLRQPLTALQVNLEVATHVLRHRPRDIVAVLAALDDAVEDGRKLADSLHVLHDLVARRQPCRTTVSLSAIVAEVARLVQSEADARQVHLSIDVAADLPTFSGDPSMLREAVLSVLLDAIENAAPPAALVAPPGPPGDPVTVLAGAVANSRRVRVAAHLRPASTEIELCVTHRRQSDGTDDDAWALRVARSVAEAHGAEMAVDTTDDGELRVRTVWPTYAAPPSRSATAS